MAGSESGNEAPGKVFNDPIHGHVELHPLLVKIIDTPQFQRLRNIKQLGGGYFVYLGACHNRFEHSIGVAHLAGELAKALKSRQPELNITDRDILCVQIAGLCHDLGHGPFSHLFDGMFIPEAVGNRDWKHEDASIKMFDLLVKCNHLERMMKDCGLVLPDDLTFIKEMINDPLKDPEAAQTEPSQWPYKGRTKDKSFLYEIVSNKRNGIDVDKFDYFARDCHHLGIQNSFDHSRFITFARVCDVKGAKQICSRDKEVGNLYNIFHTRNYIHRRACQHRVNNSIQIMIKDAFIKANRLLKLSEAKDDIKAYSKLTDHLFEDILYSDTEDLKEARQILQRIVSRKLYKFVAEAMKVDHPVGRIDKTAGHILQQELTDALLEAEFLPDDFEVFVVTFDYGMKDKDPLADTYVYRKEDVTKAYPINKSQVSNFLPVRFFENIIQVYWKNIDETHLESAKDTFSEWCKKKGFEELWTLDDEGEEQNQDQN